MAGGVSTLAQFGRTLGEHPAPPTVLIADPDDNARTRYRVSFERAGYEVIESPDGRDALTRALMQPPAVVITELHLPLLDGVALCEILRRDAATQRVPILVVTRETRASAVDRVRRAGATAVLAQSITLDELVREVGRLLTDARRVGSDLADAVSNDPSTAEEKQRPRTALARSHVRFMTSTPPHPPPLLTCPSCDLPLKYEHSYIGGVSSRHSEQWDYFTCSRCGVFQYRQRTRAVRRAL